MLQRVQGTLPSAKDTVPSHKNPGKQRDFPGGPVVKNPPSNAGDTGLIPGQGTKIPHAMGQLSPHATTIELASLNERAGVLQTTEPTHPGARTPQLERENPQATTREKPEHCNEEAVNCNKRYRMPQLSPNTAKKRKKERKKIEEEPRWQSRRMCSHSLLREHQNHN